jgi:hypothetical protein
MSVVAAAVPVALLNPLHTRGEESGINWRAPVEVATGDALQGPWRMNRSRFHYVDDPAVDLGSDGRAGIAWVDNRRQNIFYQIYDDDGRAMLEGPVDVSRSPGIFSWLPRVVLSDDGRQVFILWQEIVFSGGSHGGEAYFARSTDGGQTFSEPLNLSASQAGDGKGRLTETYWHNGSLDLARGSDGTLYAAWTEYEGALWFRRSTDGGERFEKAVRIAGTDGSPARAPDLAVGPGGNIYLVWTVGEDPAANIHVAMSTDGGRSFSEPRVLVQTAGHSDAPKIAVDSQGAVHLVLADSPAGMLRPYHVYYMRLDERLDLSIEPRRLAGPAAGGVRSVGFPALDLASDDALIVLWERFPDQSPRSRGLGFVVSTDRGQTFTPASIVPGTDDPALGFNGSLQGLLMQKIAADDSGAVVVANSHFKEHEASHVRLISGRLPGH